MTKPVENQKNVVIIGAGPAGLTAAYELARVGTPSVVLEKDDCVGGISRTVKHKGYCFDIGGHRFFTKIKAVEDLWNEVLSPDDFLERPRSSRIFYRGKFFNYPLQPFNALSGLGIWNSILIGFSYLYVQLLPAEPEETFEHWVTNRFGKRLFNIFFKTYTEKVWGIPCDQISADWAAQRIKGLCLMTAVKNAILSPNGNGKSKRNNKEIRTLIDSFHYPKQGPGMMWERFAAAVQDKGCDLRMNTGVSKIHHDNRSVTSVEITGTDGKTESVSGSDYISSMPLRELIQRMEPAPPDKVLRAANKLNYRDFITVTVIINRKDIFPDQWIYVHDPQVKVGRIQNFNNWSPFMVPDPETTCLGMEYFCFEDDGLWSASDDELVNMAEIELEYLGLVVPDDIAEGVVVRMPKAYPVYDGEYQDCLNIIRDFINSFENLQVVGRNGMHKYNNQDHSMLTAMLAVKNIFGARIDIWTINDDDKYHEEMDDGDDAVDKMLAAVGVTQPKVPRRVAKRK